MTDADAPFWGPDFTALQAEDPEIASVVLGELERLRGGLQLIASENLTSPAVLAALGSTLSNKYAEGYPGRRYYGGCAEVDKAEELLGTLDRQGLGDVHELAAAVVPPARIALGVLVRQDAALRSEHRGRGEVLAGDQLQVRALPLELVADRLGNLGVGRLEGVPVGSPVGRHPVAPCVPSIAVIWSTRRLWRPPSNGVSSHSSRISSANAAATIRAPIARTFASLCIRDMRAV